MRAVSHASTRQPWFLIYRVYWLNLFIHQCRGLVHLQVPKMDTNLTFSYSVQFLVFLKLAFGFCDLLVEDEAKMSLSALAFSMSWIRRSGGTSHKGDTWHTWDKGPRGPWEGPHFLSKGAHIFPNLPFFTDKPINPVVASPFFFLITTC